MIRHYTDKELNEVMKKLSIVIDTREQKNKHITDFLDKEGIQYESRKMEVGDYSAQIGDMTFEMSIAVERKHNLDEICQNLGTDRDRFNREFLRAKAYGTKVYLVIENATWDDIYNHNYRSALTPKALLASLYSWTCRYNVTILFCEPKYTGRIIHGLLYYAVREELQHGQTKRV